ncbi:hypothetical protein QTP70_028055, partial [Hemibagrus guttatus]
KGVKIIQTMAKLQMLHICPNVFIHSFTVYCLSDLLSGHGVPISGVIGHQGRIHPGQSANPSQGTHTHSHSLTQSHTTGNLEMPINLQYMSLDRGRKPDYPEEPLRHGENMQTPHTHGGGGYPWSSRVPAPS